MCMDHLLPSFLDEFEKIAVSSGSAGYMQTRTGRRPIRAAKLLKKETFAQKEEKDEGKSEPEDVEVEGGSGMADGAGGME